MVKGALVSGVTVEDYEAIALADLARSGISPEQATDAGMYFSDDARSDVHPSMRQAPCLVIPYFDVDGAPATWGDSATPFVRVRYYDTPPPAKKLGKYASIKGSGQKVYFARGVPWRAMLTDTRADLLITEGEKKAMAACLAGFPCLGLGGVHSFMAPYGELLPDLALFDYPARCVTIMYDSDRATNAHIRAAELALTQQLSIKRRARVHVANIPANEGSKVALDDVLVAHGPPGLRSIIATASPKSAVDEAVLRLNETCAYVLSEGRIMNIATGDSLTVAAFKEGSSESTLKIAVVKPGKKGGMSETASLPLAPLWLKHENHRIISKRALLPGHPSGEITLNGAQVWNDWKGFSTTPGDTGPFHKLMGHVCARLKDEDKDFFWKLVCYKAQNPATKTPIAVVLVGVPGSGKSLLLTLLLKAFAPYSVMLNTEAINDGYSGWMEKSLFSYFDEVEGRDVKRAAAKLRRMISEQSTSVNEKYQVRKDVESYTMYCFAANDHAAAAYRTDDRRMFIIDVLETRDADFYREVLDWRDNGGPNHLMHEMLNFDLKGWCPPLHAPATRAKALAAQEGLTEVQALAHTMLHADSNAVTMWLSAAISAATQRTASNNVVESSQARDDIALYNTFQVRPWYTAAELAKLFPFLVETLSGGKYAAPVRPGELSQLLRNEGIQYLECSDNELGFMWRGELRQYLVIANCAQLREPISQEVFEKAMNEFPTYKALTERKKK